MNQSQSPYAVFTFCPGCGSKKFTESGERSKSCGNCHFQYYFNSSAAVVALIFNENRELLFTRRGIEPHLGMLDLPGGFIEPMETAEHAIVREIREELGIELSKISYYCSLPNEYPFSGLIVFTLDLIFKVEVVDLSELRAMDDVVGYEFIDITKMDIDEIPAYSMRQVVKKLIEER